jgi:hypothetical protein
LGRELDGGGRDGSLVVGSGGEAGIEADGGVVGVVELAGEAGRGEVDGDRVEHAGGGGVGVDDGGGLGDDFEPAGVVGGEFEAVEEGVGARDVDEIAGEGIDDLGEGELDGDAVFERREGDDVATLHEAFFADHGGAVEVVTAVEALVEVAEVRVGEGDGAALEAVGLDVAAEVVLHGDAPCTPPGGWGDGYG